MPRIRIENLPHNQTISKEELKKVKGGILWSPVPYFPKIDTFSLNTTIARPS
jgi:hypothetical protein